MMRVLLTGGAGYIGSHTAVELLNEGYDVIIVDDLSNSSIGVLKSIEKITNKKPVFYQESILNKPKLKSIFQRHNIEAVIHFAGFKAVGESTKEPLKYYHNNVSGTIILCEVMKEYSVFNLIFSSSATVYGKSNKFPFCEDAATEAINPYGNTKLVCEEILHDLSQTNSEWKIALLRYFNPIGAHESGMIGEKPNGVPNNLMPYITQVAKGERDILNVFGNDYPTPDGTGVRDYIHVVDLAKGHIAALKKIKQMHQTEIFNLGSGRGYSVLELINTFYKVTKKNVPYKITRRRPGDVAYSYANVTKSKTKLNWQTEKTIDDMCRDAWRWRNSSKTNFI